MSSSSAKAPHPLVVLVLARLREFIREPAAIFWVYGFPLIMMIALGVAFRSKPLETIKVDVVKGKHASWVEKALKADKRFQDESQNAVQSHDLETCKKRLRTGKTSLVIIVDVESSQEMTYLYDPTRPGCMLAREAADEVIQFSAGRVNPIPTHFRELTGPGSRYIDFLIPGLLGMGLMGGGMWGVGFAIVDLRIRKLLKRYLATPMKRGHFLAGMMISRLLFVVPEILAVVLFARFLFGVEVQGSYLAVAFLVVLGSFQFAGVGLLIASRAQTLETISGLMNLVMLPMWICSGVFYSIDRFPESIQPLLRVLPLTALNDALRGVMQEGASLVSFIPQLILIIAWGGISFVIALRIFRWN